MKGRKVSHNFNGPHVWRSALEAPGRYATPVDDTLHKFILCGVCELPLDRAVKLNLGEREALNTLVHFVDPRVIFLIELKLGIDKTPILLIHLSLKSFNNLWRVGITLLRHHALFKIRVS